MSRTETLLALAAVVCASLAALQVPGRLIFAFVAVALLLAVGGARLRASVTTSRKSTSGFDPAERARQIREARQKRSGD